MRVRKSLLVAIALEVGGLVATARGASFPWPKVAVVIRSDVSIAEDNDHKSLSSLLALIGMSPEQISLQTLATLDLLSYRGLVIPFASAKNLPPESVKKIVEGVRHGLRLVTDGPSPLSEALGIEVSTPIIVEQIQDVSETDLAIHWADRPAVSLITQWPTQKSGICYRDMDNHPLLVRFALGRGQVLFSSSFIDPLTANGYARFPAIPSILVDMGFLSPIRAQQGEVYFEAGDRYAVPIEKLAARWRQWGINTVYVGAWTMQDHPADCDRLIHAAHKNGVKVYVWFEWPEVTTTFWDKHPSWREKTASLADAHVNWRSLMNFQNPDCLKEVLAETKIFLRSHDWDGVNVGEVYFEPVTGLKAWKELTPMNQEVRDRFQKTYRFDPIALFQEGSPHYWKTHPDALSAFYSFRKLLSAELLERMLKAVSEFRRDRDWEVMLTVIDIASDAELSNYIANDVPTEIALARRYHATFQVEDPYYSWAKPPARYPAIAAVYEKTFGLRPDVLDINIVPIHGPHDVSFPTSQAMGTEAFQLWRHAAIAAPRVCFYSESSMYQPDWSLMPSVMGSLATVHVSSDTMSIQTPHAVQLRWKSSDRLPVLDGASHPCLGDHSVWIPAGNHTLTMRFDPMPSQAPTLLSASCEITDCRQSSNAIELQYDATGRCIFVLNQPTATMSVDGRAIKRKSNDDPIYFAPSGQHHLSFRS